MDFERHYLSRLFEPQAIAVVGASDTVGSIGQRVFTNLVAGGYQGKLFAVNPHHPQVAGCECYPTVEAIPQRLDLAILCTRAEMAPDLVEACGRAGTRYAMIITDGFGEIGERGAALERETRERARGHGVRLIGPRCMGFLRPSGALNASYSNVQVKSGTVGIISQSNGLLSAALDWSDLNGVGISLAVSLGDESDLKFAEVLEYMVADPRTQSIFLYIESVKDARRFMSALRAAARCKPVLLLKIGRQTSGVRAKPQLVGNVGADDVFDAALRRAGVVRIPTISQMFFASQALFSRFRPRGNRLAIITNGGGPGVMAGDRAADLGIPLVRLDETLTTRLAAHMPTHWIPGNPIDILSDASPVRYAEAIKACLAHEGTDGLVVLLTPQARSNATQIAEAVIEVVTGNQKPVVACWMGGTQVKDGMQALKDAGIPTFATPEPAVELFSHLSNYYRAQQLLVQSPSSQAEQQMPSRLESARLVIETALMEGRKALSAMEAKAVLAAFQIPIAQTVVARSATEAMVLAEELGLPVVLKVASPDIQRKSECGGIRVGLENLVQVREAYQEILDTVRTRCPQAHIDGIAIEPMVCKPNGREVMVGMTRDQVFGPVIVFGPGGSRPNADPSERVVALPPLNTFLASDMLKSSRARTWLEAFGALPAVDMESLHAVLQRVSEMVCELPWLTELTINPLIIDENGAVAVDAHLFVANVPLTARRYDHVAVHPYPQHLVSSYQTPDGTTVTVRPIRPDDAEMEQVFVQRLSPETRYMRFMNTIRELSPSQLTRLTQIDYDRELAFVAVVEKEDPPLEVGVARYVTNPDGETCEFAIVVADDWAGKGLARRLMGAIIEAARDAGLKAMTGEFLAENTRMIRFVQSLGFVISAHPDDSGLKLGVLTLND